MFSSLTGVFLKINNSNFMYHYCFGVEKFLSSNDISAHKLFIFNCLRRQCGVETHHIG